MSCCTLPPQQLPIAKMLTLSQVSLLVSKTSRIYQDSNNNSPGCGALALKMVSSRSSARAKSTVPSAGPKRCLFGAPGVADTQRLLQEDREAVQARMQRRWGWDLNKERPSSSSSWQWESVRAPRPHPYAVRVVTPKPTIAPITPVPALISPLPATPTVLDSSGTSSSSGTSTMPASPSSPALASPSSPSWDLESDSEDSCCGDSESDSSSSTSPRARRSSPHSPVQSRITDFWRTRRCSTSEGKSSPVVVPTSRPSAQTCSF